MTCVALALVPVGCQHMHLVDPAQAIPARGKVVHPINTLYFALPCPVTHVIMDRHLRGVPRDGLLSKIHTLDGARGPLVVIIAMSGTKVHREDRPRPGPMQKLRLWMNVTRTRERPLRMMPWAVRQQTPPGTLREMLPQRRMPRCGDWRKSIAC